MRIVSYFFSTRGFQDVISGSAQPQITRQGLEKIQIPLPPLPTQRAIAERLDRADALRQKDRQLLQEYDALAEAVFVEMFGDPVRNERGWEVNYLGKYFSNEKEGTKCGPFGSALKKDEYVKSGIPVWVMDNIISDEFTEDGCLFITNEKFQELESYKCENGDIIISRAGTVGKMCVVASSFTNSIISTNLIRLSLNKDTILPVFFVKLFKYYGKQLGRLKTGKDGAFTHMNTGILKSLKVPIPPLSLQSHFDDILANIEKQKTLVRKQQAESEALFGRLLQEAFET